MKIALVGEMDPAIKGAGKASESQVNAGGFDIAMAAVMSLLKPNTNESTPVQSQNYGEPVISEEIAGISAENMLSLEMDDILPQQSMLLGSLAADALAESGKQAQTVTAGDGQLPLQQRVQTPKNVFPPVFGQIIAEAMPAEKQAGAALSQAAQGAVKFPENADVQKAAVKKDSSINDARTVNTDQAPSHLFTGPSKEIAIKPVNQGMVLQGAPENNFVVAEGDSARAAPSVFESNMGKTVPPVSGSNAEKAVSSMSGSSAEKTVPPVSGSSTEKAAPGNSLAGTFTLGANVQAASVKVNTGAEAGQGRGTGEVESAEGKENVMLSGKIEAGGTASAGKAKNENGGFNNFSGDTLQPDSSQLSTVGTLSSSSKELKGVALPALKDVLVQEIKFICDTHKGKSTQVQITLEPENLGKLTIKLFYNNGELNAHFYAGNEHVRGVLESSMQQLRENLGQQDLVLNQAFVSVGDEKSGGAGRQMDFSSRQMEHPSDKNSGPFYQQSIMEPDGYNRAVNEFTQVNYLI